MNLSYRIYHVFMRNLISYRRFIFTTFLVSLGQPLFYLITFGIGMGAYMGGLGGKSYLHYLVPGVLMSSVMMSATFECLYGTFVKMVHQHIYDSLIATPVSVEDAIAGDIVWGAFRGWISGFLMLIVSLALGVFPFSWFHAGILLVFMAFIGILFASFAMIVTSFAPNFDFFSYYTELCITPMIFFSSVFFPLDKFPGWLKTCSLFLPLTHAVNISRSLFSGQASSMHVGISFIVLAMACLVAFFSGLALMKRRLVK